MSVLERFEDHAARWHATTGGSVVSTHAYALPEGTDEADLRARMRSALDRLYPETTALTVVHEEWLVERDCVLVGLEPWRSRPAVHPGPARRARRGRGAVRPARRPHGAGGDDGMDGRGPAPRGGGGPRVSSVPMGSRLGPLPRLARRGIGLPLGGGAAAPETFRRRVDEVVGPGRRADARIPTAASGARPRATRNPNQSENRDDGLRHAVRAGCAEQ